uniref:Uncharacterized protein n=1 Tax=Spongospora subterranea TaxID=70186 RepID=A0A0H5RBY1_9EUKA|eukprot:CRZ11533.1 hypothetical protein [Spongospora subterranea]
MRQGNKNQMESTLRRIFDVAIMQDMVYFETAVLVENKSLQPKGYFVFLICNNAIFIVQIDEVRSQPKDAPVCIPLLNILAIERLKDTAKFLEESIASDSQHIKVCIDDQMAMEDSVHLYTIFSDSQLFFFMEGTWTYKRIEQAWPSLYASSKCVAALHLKQHESSILFRTLLTSILKASSVAEKTDALENLAMVVGGNMFCKVSAFQAQELHMLLFRELLGLGTLQTQGFLESTVDGVDAIIVENLDLLKQYLSILLFYHQLLSGGCRLLERIALISGSYFQRDEFIHALLCLPILANRSTGTPGPAEIKHLSNPTATGAGLKSDASITAPTLHRILSPIKPNQPVLEIVEEHMSPVQRKLVEIDHLQAAVSFQMIAVFDQANHMPTEGLNLDREYLLTLLSGSSEYCEKRVPRSFMRISHLLRVPCSPHVGCLLYMHAFILYWLCKGNGRIRKIIRSKCFAEMQLLSGPLIKNRVQCSTDSFFYAKGKALVQLLLDDILQDINDD